MHSSLLRVQWRTDGVLLVSILIVIIGCTGTEGAEWGEACDNGSNVCNTAKFLECDPQENVCRCQGGPESRYDEYDKSCHKLESSLCDPWTMTCPLNGFCNLGVNPYACQCRPATPVTIRRDCAAAYRSTCATSSICDHNAYVQCIDKDTMTCKCDDTTSVYDIEGQHCLLRASQPCSKGTIDRPAQSCITGSECIVDGEDSKCRCVDGLSENQEYLCRVNIGGTCTDDLKCDEAAFLICDDDSKCNCKPGLYDDGNGVCVAPYDGFCAAGEKCDSSLFLDCIDDKCKCRADLIDVGSGDCKSPSGGACGNGEPDCDVGNYFSCGSDNFCHCKEGLVENIDGVCRATLYHDCGVGLPCDEKNFLYCGEEGKCVCNDGLADINGICTASLGGSCAGGEPCDTSKFLACNSDLSGDLVCSCVSDSWFDNNQQVCSIRAGFSCQLVPEIGSQTCGQNSHCAGTSDADAICKCDGDLLPSVEGKCSLAGGQTCNPFQDQCDTAEWQSCDSGTFKCRCVEHEQVVEESCGRCRIRAEYPCEPDPTTMPCTTNAVCRDAFNRHFCVCDHGLLPNSVGKCTLTYGQDCGPTAPGSCDYEGFQTCVGGGCSCMDIDNMYYDHHPEGKKCFFMVGKTCQVGSVVPCARHASCVGNTCACDTGYTADGDGGCKSSVTLHSFWSQLPTYSNLFRRTSYKFKLFQE